MAALTDIVAGLSAPTPPSDPTALNGDQQAFLDQLNASSASAAPAPKKGGGTTPWGVLGRVLNDTIGVPIHASEALAVNAGRGVGQLFGQDYGANNPSLGNVWNQIVKPADQFHGTDFILGNEAKGLTRGLYGQRGIISNRTPGPLSTMALGLALDVGADPLTLVSPSGEVHGAEAVARLVAEEAGKRAAVTAGRDLGAEGLDALLHGRGADLASLSPERATAVAAEQEAGAAAVKAARTGGASNLTAQQIEDYGAGRLGRGLEIKLPGDRSIPVTPKFDNPLSAISVGRNQLKGLVGDALFGKDAPNALARMGSAPDLMFGARHGDMAATISKGIRATSILQARALDTELGGHLADAIKGASNDDLKSAWNAIDEQITPADPKIAQLASDISEVHAHIAYKMVEGGIRTEENLMAVGTYVPHPVANEAPDIMQHAGLWPAREDLPSAGRGFMENKRTFYDPSNGQWSAGIDTADEAGQPVTSALHGFANSRADAERQLGEAVAKNLSEKEAAGNADTIQYLAENPHIAEQVKAGEVPIFKEPRAAMEHMVRSVSRRIAQARAGRQMFLSGLMGDAGGTQVDPRFLRGTLSDAAEVAHVANSPEGLAAQKAAADAQAATAATQQNVADIAGRAGAAPPEMPPEAPPTAPVGPEPTPPAPASAPQVDTAPTYHSDLQAKTDAILRGENVPPAPGEANLEADRAAAVQRGAAIKAAIAPEVPGMVRLYNGGGKSFFSPEITRAMSYAGESNDLRYIDVNPAAYKAMQEASAGSTLGESATTAGDVVLGKDNPHLLLAKDIPRDVTAQVGHADNVSGDLNAPPANVPSEAPVGPPAASAPQTAVPPRIAGPTATLPPEAPVREVLRRAAEIDKTVDTARTLLQMPANSYGGESYGLGRAADLRAAARDLHIFGSATMPEEQLRTAVEHEVEQHTANAAAHSAQVEGRAAEAAHQAANSAALPDYTTGAATIKRGEAFWQARQQAVGDAADAKAGIADAQAQLADVRKTIAAVEQTGGVKEIGATDRVAKQLEKLQTQREALATAIEQKKALDMEDVVRRAQEAGRETGIPDVTEQIDQGTLRGAVNRLGAPSGADAGEVMHTNDVPLNAQDQAYADYKNQGANSEGASDAAVTRQLQDQLSQLDQRIEGLKSAPTSDKPITNLDLYKAREETLQGKVAQHTAELNDAQQRLARAQRLGVARTVSKSTVTPGSALDEAYQRFNETANKVSEQTFLGEASDQARTQFSTNPIEGWQNGEPVTLREGTTRAEANALKPEVAQQHADIIRAQWNELAQTADAHDHMAEAFRTYANKINEAIPASPKRDLIALTDSQIDQAGMAGNNPEGATRTANDLLGQTAAEMRMPNEIIRGPVKESAHVASIEVRNMLDLLKRAAESNDPALREVANLRIIAANAGHLADLNGRSAQETLDAWDRAMADPIVQGQIKSLLQRGTIDYNKYRMLQPGLLTPRDVADQIMAFDKYNPEPNVFFDGVRKMIKYMRTWQIVTPGFHMRVTFGGMINNALFGVQARDYTRAIELWTKWARGIEMTGKDAEDFEKLSTVLHPGQQGSQAILHDPTENAGLSRFNPLSTKGPIVKFNYKLGAGSQYMTRAAMGMKVIREGGSIDEIAYALDKYHFNYGDLGAAEQKIKQNVAPFFTWTRHNLPLQVQQLVDNPKLYSRFLSAKQNIESQSTLANGEVIPGFAANSLLIRLPFMSGGGHSFITPDLPFRSLTDIAAPIDAFTSGKGDFSDRVMQGFSGPLGQMSPVIAGPIEAYFGKQVFHGIPIADNKGTALSALHIPEFLHVPLDLAGVTAVDQATGKPYLTNRSLYLINKLMPIFARQQALSGSGNQHVKDSQMAKLISFFLGTTVTTNTLKQQSATNYVNSLETKRLRSITNSLQGQ